MRGKIANTHKRCNYFNKTMIDHIWNPTQHSINSMFLIILHLSYATFQFCNIQHDRISVLNNWISLYGALLLLKPIVQFAFLWSNDSQFFFFFLRLADVLHLLHVKRERDDNYSFLQSDKISRPHSCTHTQKTANLPKITYTVSHTIATYTLRRNKMINKLWYLKVYTFVLFETPTQNANIQ